MLCFVNLKDMLPLAVWFQTENIILMEVNIAAAAAAAAAVVIVVTIGYV